jgi:hypothetical protein
MTIRKLEFSLYCNYELMYIIKIKLYANSLSSSEVNIKKNISSFVTYLIRGTTITFTITLCSCFKVNFNSSHGLLHSGGLFKLGVERISNFSAKKYTVPWSNLCHDSMYVSTIHYEGPANNAQCADSHVQFPCLVTQKLRIREWHCCT